MNAKRNLALGITALVIAILACNLPAQNPNAGATPTFTAQATQASTSAPATTPTPSTPQVSVSTATNCRTGPGPNYDLVLVFQPGATAPVVARYSPGNYWIITTPTGGTCWLWGAYATVQGNTSTLAEMAPPAAPPTQVASNPPTSQPKPTAAPTKVTVGPIIGPIINPGIIKIALPPAAPSKLTVTTTCQYISFPVQQLISRVDSLSWTSVSNADGYYVYDNNANIGGKITQTSYQIPFDNTTGSIQFGVSATNSFGTSAITYTSSKCP